MRNLVFMLIGTFFVLHVTHSRECKYIDIRNNVTQFRKLENCTAVLGFLTIVLIDAKPEVFAKLHFPELREVTGFVFLYRLQGLKSLRHIFPNLQIIRGNELFVNTALTFYELFNITEVGLPSLQQISRGAVRIQKCPKICDADTFDFHTNHSTNILRDYGSNCTDIEYPKSFDEKNIKCTSTKDDFVCVVSKLQEIPLEKCHDLCMFGCHNITASGCYVCKGPRDNGVCVEKCPANKLYDEKTMRCVTVQECITYSADPELRKFIYAEESLCVTTCPKGFSEKDPENEHKIYHDFRCRPCGKCPKICHGLLINYVEDAQKLHGCNIIDGSLTIKIDVAADRPDLMDELTKSLDSIEIISGYLKIYRSYPLTSLDFLKNLRVIGGKTVSEDYFALYIFDNSNLQALWDPHPDFEIQNGTVMFSTNENLCPQLVRDFLEKTNQTSPDIYIDTNGNMKSCHTTTIDVSHEILSPRNVTIRWSEFKVQPNEQLEGYLIYFMETPHTNITHFYGAYTCAFNTWNIKTVKISQARRVSDGILAFNLTGLQTRTQYAYYVRTIFAGNFRMQGQSEIFYFKTPVKTLNQVRNLGTFEIKSHAIMLKWRIGRKDTEHIHHFSIDVLRQPDDLVLKNRDFCEHPHVYDIDEEDEKLEEEFRLEYCCCPDLKKAAENKDEYDDNDDDEEDENDDDEYSLSHVTKYNKEEDLIDITKNSNYVKTHKFMMHEVDVEHKWYRYEIDGLQPFTYYSFQVFACEENSTDANDKCSSYALHSERTNPHPVEPIHVILQQVGEYNETIEVSFEHPNETNGGIVAYIMEEKRDTRFNIESKCFSVIKHSVWNQTFMLPAGVAQLRFQAVFLSGFGAFTDWFNITVYEAPEPPSAVMTCLEAFFFSIAVCGSVFGTIWFRNNQDTICRKRAPPTDRGDMEMLVVGFQSANVDEEELFDIPLDSVTFDEADFY
ncbi:insulin-like growth factor 1 receptor [Culicoides brevitarsis]|uniref:insulin-like growth factor 1 receptor n=1 Tax=Culicoides brevitarsis TaxID=469753 RepID=UPI00307C8C62